MTKDKLNSNGNRRGMSQNSQKHLRPRQKGNNNAKKGISITRIERGMMGQLCPYAKTPGQTWAQAIADSEMRDALESQKARDSIKDRSIGIMELLAILGFYTILFTGLVIVCIISDLNKKNSIVISQAYLNLFVKPPI